MPPTSDNASPELPAGGRASAEAESANAIAVTGLVCRFPDAPDAEAFWQNLLAGRDSIAEVPPERWDWREFWGDPKSGGNKTASKWGGFVADADKFDATFFKITAREAGLMDPQQRWLLELAWHALEDAGERPGELAGSATGVFIGACNADYAELMDATLPAVEGHGPTGTFFSILANRISHVFDFRGPSFTVDTACSASLLSVHAACQALRAGECERALAGGVNLCWTPKRFIAFSRAGMLSPDGRCRAFGAGANGYVRGEGAGLVVLKTLARARADGDRIYGVIRASGSNHGGRVKSLTVPSASAQAALLAETWKRAGVDIGALGLIEAHGTGTMLGDPIEVQGIKQAFATVGAAGLAVGACGLGSVKSNIGHLEAAAGIAGLIKILLALRARTKPPTLHVATPNPLVKLDGGPLRLLARGEDWPAPRDSQGRELRRVAAVSSFGFGGASAHVVVEECGQGEGSEERGAGTEGAEVGSSLVVASARTEADLRAWARDFARWLAANPEANVADVAFTLRRGREEMPARAAWLARDLVELRGAVAAWLASNVAPAAEVSGEAVAWLAGGSLPRPAAGAGRLVSLPGYAFARERHWLPGVEGPVRATPVVETVTPAVKAVSAQRGAVLAWVTELLADETRLPATRLGPDCTFEDIGLDSLLVEAMNERLAARVPGLPATLLYEQRTPGALAAYLCANHGASFGTDTRPMHTETPPPGPVRASTLPDDGVAIIGVAGRYPGAEDMDALWNLLAAGRDAFREVPAERWDWRTWFEAGPDGAARGKIYHKWGAWLGDADKFDPLFFKLSPREADGMDPQERVFLETAWAALEDAGWTPSRLKAGREAAPVGVFVGATSATYHLHAVEEWKTGAGDLPLTLPWSLANRVSYHFGFEGPSMPVDTACSSSLTAIHLACESLRRGECEVALAGGVNLYLHPLKYHHLCALRMVSADGVCRPFGAGADGFVPGEGVGAVVLKPLATAKRDGDRIWGAIRGTAVAHGGQTNGYTVPNPAAQARVIAEAWRRAGVDLAGIDYVEAHGTGTALGDPVEIRGLELAGAERAAETGGAMPAAGAVPVGSIKGNLGHLEAAAGIASLAKVLLQFRHGCIAPTLHAERLNPAINFATSPLAPAREDRPWNAGRDGGPRRAAISSFGAGGVNAHVVVEEACAVAAAVATDSGPQVIVLSAREPERLRAQAERLADWLERASEAAERFADVAWTLQIGREPLAARLALVASDAAEAARMLRAGTAGEGVAGNGDLAATAKTWVAGGEVDWRALHGAESARRRVLSLPTYAFARRRCWFAKAKEPAEPTTPDMRAAWAGLEAQARAALERVWPEVETARVAESPLLTACRAWRERIRVADMVAGMVAPALAAHGRLLAHCAPELPRVLRDERAPEEVLFPDGSGELVGAIYRDNPEADHLNRAAAEAVREAVAATPAGRVARIVEIGAGTGGTTAAVLPALASRGREVEYVFTDASAALVRAAKKRFGATYDFVRFATLDVEREAPEAAAGGLADVVVAANVLHATADLPAVLRRVRASLRPGGRLVLVEAVEDHIFLTLTFGLLPGWWRAKDGRRLPHSPLVDRAGWTRLLVEADFGSVRWAGGWDGIQDVVTAEATEPARVMDVARVEERVREQLAAVLELAPAELNREAPPTDYGVDSITAVEVVRRINADFGVELRSTDLFGYASIRKLAAHVATKLGARPVAAEKVEPARAEVTKASRREADDDAIAVIGMAGRFPDAANVEAFWQNLLAGRDSVWEIPASRWPLEGFYSVDREAADRSYAKWGAFIDDVEMFDPLFFSMSPREAELTDPQQRIFLQEAWRALEHAGYPDRELDGSRTGVFVGYAEGDYRQKLRAAGLATEAHAFTGNAGSILAARLAYLLNLKGPALVVDTACSSSLVAIHLAAESLRSRVTDMALAGGVNLYLTPELFLTESRAGMLSPRGRTRAFDAGADGFGLGEAAGVVVLKRLADARRAGDRILGVIRGTATNQDGRTNGITAPSGPAQTELVAGLYAKLGIAAESIGYVEAHGTGTKLGDPIEVAALADAFAASLGTGLRGACVLGSVKTNVGHTQIAAGVTSVIKVLQQLRRGMIAPTLHFERANPLLKLDETPFRVATGPTAWSAGSDGVRRAAVSAFGFSGTNAHLVIDEAPVFAPVARARRRPLELLVISARTPEALERRAAELAAWLRENPGVSLAALAYTLARTRSHFASRAAVVVAGGTELAEVANLFAALGEGRTPSGAWRSTEKGEPLSAAFRQFALHLVGKAADGGADDGESWAALADLYARGAEWDWERLYPRGSAELADAPAYPFARERCWIDAMPGAVAGLEQGGTATDALGELCVEASLGEGLVYRPRWAADAELLRDHRVGGESVLPGAATVALALAAARRRGWSGAITLADVFWVASVRVAAGAKLETEFRLSGEGAGMVFELRDAAGKTVATGRMEAGGAADRLDVAALRARCGEAVTRELFYAELRRVGIEHGPTLQGVDAAWIGAGEACARLRLETGEAATTQAVDVAIQTVSLLQSGVTETLVPYGVRRVCVVGVWPAQAWAHVRRTAEHEFEIVVADATGAVSLRIEGVSLRATSGGAVPATDACEFWMPVWTPLAASAETGKDEREPHRILLVVGEGMEALAEELAKRASAAQVCRMGMAEVTRDAAKHAAWLGEGGAMWWLAPVAARSETALWALLKAAVDLRGLRVKVVTSGSAAVDGSEDAEPVGAALRGLVLAVAKESPEQAYLWCDIDPRGDVAQAAEMLAKEPAAVGGEAVAWRDGVRYGRVLRRAKLPEAAAAAVWREREVVAVIGGAGGLGLALSKHLAATVRARLVWIGRRERTAEIDAAAAEIEAAGGEVFYERADVADAGALREAWRQAEARFGRITTVVHSAIVLRDRTLRAMTAEDFVAALAPKVAGLAALGEVWAESKPERFIVFSSAQSFSCDPGQANYAAASCALDEQARWLGARFGVRTQVLNWGYWGGVGVVASEDYNRRLAAQGIGAIQSDEGMDALARVLASGRAQVMAIKADAAYMRRLDAEAGEWRAVEKATAGVVGADLVGEWRTEQAPELAENFAAVQAIGRGELHAALRRMGWLAVAGERRGAETLPRELGVASGQERLWAAVTDIACAAGWIVRDGAAWVTTTAGAAAEVEHVEGAAGKLGELAAYGRLLRPCVAALSDVLTGRRSGVSVLFPEGDASLVEAIYRDDAITARCNRHVAELAVAEARERGRLRVLEVGAGTGGTTRVVLPALATCGVEVEYAFTDVSPAFAARAAMEWGARYPWLRTAVLDVERAPAEQGFAEGTFDVVIATNVLHATADAARSLRHVKTLLRAGGRLLLNEATRTLEFGTLTFGLTDGWWRYRDAATRLAGGPLLSARRWAAALRAEGFAGVSARSLETGEFLRQSVIVATSDGWVAKLDVAGEARVALGDSRTEPAPEAKTSGKNGTEPVTDVAAAWIREVFAEVLKVPAGRIRDDATFDRYGVDSLVVIQLNKRFERRVGRLRATLLFEHRTVAELAGYFAANHAAAFGMAVAGPARRVEAARVESARVVTATAAAAAPKREAETARALETGPADAIAIVGMSGRYPMAGDLNEFWANLRAGRHCVTEIPRDRWDWREHFDTDPTAAVKSASRWGGFLADVDKFDPLFFRISPKEAEEMDPQERLFLETAWAALEDAGYAGSALDGLGREAGVFVGVMSGNYDWYGAESWWRGKPHGAHAAYWSKANRVSYHLDLKGPSLAVDTACSSSLTAIHLACESLRAGGCRLAIAGGVNLILHPLHMQRLSRLRMLAPDDRCKSFGAGADGFVDGEGVGALVLRRLSDAVRDGDNILGVIRGSRLNAGGRTSGFTVPNPRAQAELLRACWTQAGVDARSIGCIEAHGTGTELGDPIEVAGLTEAFEQWTRERGFCALGSVKSNLGHLEAAAGVAGVTKLLLQMRAGELAPTLFAEECNPKIDFAATPFVLQRALGKWTPVNGRRRAGVSSFGAGGANAHVLLEDWPRESDVGRDKWGNGNAGGEAQLIVLSARTSESLRAAARRLAEWARRDEPGVGERAVAEILGVSIEAIDAEETLAGLGVDAVGLRRLEVALGREPGSLAGGETTRDLAVRTGEAARLADVAFTLQTGRAAMEERVAWVAVNLAELAAQASAWAEGAHTAAASGRVREEGRLLSGKAGEAFVSALVEARDLAQLARLWVAGETIEWGRLHQAGSVRRVSLPTYVFAKKRCWIPAEHLAGGENAKGGRRVANEEGADQIDGEDRAVRKEGGCPLFVAQWYPENGDVVAAGVASRVWVVGADAAAGWAEGVAAWHRAAGAEARVATMEEAIAEAARTDAPTRWVVLAGFGERSEARRSDEAAAALALVRAVDAAPGAGGTMEWVFLTKGTQPVLSGARVNADAAALHGLARTLACEYAHWRVAAIDLDGAADAIPADWTAVFGAPAWGAVGPTAWREGRRYVRRLAPMTLASNTEADGVRAGGVYLILGGLGGVGLAVAEHWLTRRAARVIIAGRREADAETKARAEAWASAGGGEVMWARADAADADALAAAVEQARARFGVIHGVVLATLTLDDRALARTDGESLARVMRAKAGVALAVQRVFADASLDFLLVCSSALAFAGAAGQGNYAMATAWLDGWAQDLTARGLFPVRLVHWGFWGGVGSVATPAHRTRLAAQGFHSIEAGEGMAVIDAVLGQGVVAAVAMKIAPAAQARLGVATDPGAGRRLLPAVSPPLLDEVRWAAPALATGEAMVRAGLEAFRRLEAASAPELAALWRAQGVFFAEEGERAPRAEVARRLGLAAKYARLLEALGEMLERAGLIRRERTADATEDAEWWVATQTGARARAGDLAAGLAREAWGGATPHAELLAVCLAELGGVLRGETPATDVLFSGGGLERVEGIYRGDAVAEYFNATVVETVRAAVRARLARVPESGRVRLLEIGAGTGGTTRRVLPALAEEFSGRFEYVYTDVSPVFVRHGRDNFGQAHPEAVFRVLDIGRDPAEQGFGEGDFDVVIAANVLHATRELRATLGAVKRLLRRHGWLVANEVVRVQDFTTLTFGLLDGWWLYEDAAERLPGSPLAETAQWRRLLRELGFAPVCALGAPDDEAWPLPQQVLVAESDGLVVEAGEGRDSRNGKADFIARKRPARAEWESSGEAALEEQIRAVVADVLGVSLAEFPPDAAFADFGVDSIQSIAVIGRLNERFGMGLRSTDLFNHPNVPALAAHGRSRVRVKSERVAAMAAETADDLVRMLERLAAGEIGLDEAERLAGGGA